MAGQISVTINDKAFLKKVKALNKKFPGVVDDAVKKSAFFGERILRGPPTPRITGNLRRGFKTEKISDGIWVVINRVKYALKVDELRGFIKKVIPRIQKKLTESFRENLEKLRKAF